MQPRAAYAPSKSSRATIARLPVRCSAAAASINAAVNGEPSAAQASACRSKRVVIPVIFPTSISHGFSGYREGHTTTRGHATKGRTMSVEDPPVDPRPNPDDPDATEANPDSPPANPGEGNPLPDEDEGSNDVSPGGE